MTLSLMRMEAVEAAVGLKKSKIYALMSEGKFPQPVKIAGPVNGWPSTEIEAWVAQKIAERDRTHAPA
jgi:prophage regulatory protein